MKKTIVVLLAVALAAVGAWFLLPRGVDAETPAPKAEARATETDRTEAAGAERKRRDDRPAEKEENAQDATKTEADAEPEPEDELPLSEEDAKAAEEDRLVDAFDELTDKWTEPRKGGVTMADVAKFSEQFRKVPKARQDECIHRALNLVPDDNVMLLAGILMDGEADKDVRETVFNDVLNRDESVKKPILLQIYKDRAHPCWADVAWILDVTGETPKK